MKECDNIKIHISNNFLMAICLLIMSDTLLLVIPLHCNTSLHFTTLHPTMLHLKTGGTTTTQECSWRKRKAVLLLYTDWKHQVFAVACSEWLECASAFRVGSSNPSLARRSCACASLAFVAGISSWFVDFNTLVPLLVQLLGAPPGLFSESPHVFRRICFQLFRVVCFLF
jgi:hypothetical protein